MPWTVITRTEHDRMTARHPSDLTDEEWAVPSSLVPPARRGGRPRTTDMRDVSSAILYIAEGGVAWRMLAKDFPLVSTVRGCFHQWRNDGTLAQMNCALVQLARELAGREPCPSAGIIDGQSVKTTEGGGVCGHDAGKKIAGRKRHVITDTNGFMVGVVVHGAAIQDRDGALPVLQSIRRFHPFLRHVFPAPCLRRWRLRWRQAETGVERQGRLDHRSHQAIGQGQEVQGSAAPMGGGTHLRMARQVSPSGKGLGSNDPRRNGMDADRQYPHHDPAAGKTLLHVKDF